MIPVMIVPTLDQSECLSRMLRSVDRTVGHLVVVDNGRWWPREAPLELPDTPWALRRTVTELPGNLGVAGGWNVGIKGTPYAPWWLIVNDDVEWPPGALERAEEAAGPAKAVVFGDPVSRFAAFALGERAVEKAGLFDERFHPAYYEDNDYSRRLKQAGIPLEAVDLGVLHGGSRSLEGREARNEFTFRGNRMLFESRSKVNAPREGPWSLKRRRWHGWDRGG